MVDLKQMPRVELCQNVAKWLLFTFLRRAFEKPDAETEIDHPIAFIRYTDAPINPTDVSAGE